jgi:hypothetical protein
MKGYISFTDIFIYKQFSCHEFIKKSIFVANIDKINNFQFCLIRQLKLDVTVMHHFTPETENVEFYDVTKKMIWWQPSSTAWADWFVTRKGESIKCVVWHLVLIVWSNRIGNC